MAGWLPKRQQLLNWYDSKQHEQKQVKMRFYDLQLTANVCVSPSIPGRVSPVIFISDSDTAWVSWKWYSFQMDENVPVYEKSKGSRWKGDKWNFCRDGLCPASRLVYLNRPTMCPEATSSSVSLNPRWRWGFKVAGQLSGSADRVLIRSHSASVLELSGDVKKERGHVLVRSRSFLRFSYL